MRILVTGAEGFVGIHLTRHLAEHGHSVVAASRSGTAGERLDLPDDQRAFELLQQIRPHAVVHLAGISSPAMAAQDCERALRVNVHGTRSLLRGALAAGLTCRFLFVSSSAVYGEVPPDAQPIRETEPGVPGEPYGFSKLAAECLFHLLAKAAAERIHWTIARPFNHTGPGQASDFVLSSFARQIAELERGSTPARLQVGNLDVERDFLDVRDVVNAYRLLVEGEYPGRTFNVCLGKAFVLRDLLEILRSFAAVPFKIEADPRRVRLKDAKRSIGDARELRAATGWVPSVPITRTMQELLSYWRSSGSTPRGVPA